MKYEIEAITKQELHEEFQKFRIELMEQLGTELPKILKPAIEQAVKQQLGSLQIVTKNG